MKNSLLILTMLALTSIAVSAQTESRVIRMDKVSDSADKYLEITSFKVGNTEINFNENFVADENWLRDIRVTIKNISGKNISCLGLSLGLLEGISEVLKPQESWRYVIGFYKGNCFPKEGKSKGDFSLKNGELVTLTSAEIPNIFADYISKPEKYKFHQARFVYNATLFFEGQKEEADTSYYSAPNNLQVIQKHN